MNPLKKKEKKVELSKDDTTKKLKELDEKLKKQKKVFEDFLKKIEQQKNIKNPK